MNNEYWQCYEISMRRYLFWFLVKWELNCLLPGTLIDNSRYNSTIIVSVNAVDMYFVLLSPQFAHNCGGLISTNSIIPSVRFMWNCSHCIQCRRSLKLFMAWLVGVPPHVLHWHCSTPHHISSLKGELLGYGKTVGGRRNFVDKWFIIFRRYNSFVSQ